MELYHFTAPEYLPAIFADGLRFGDVPTSKTEGIDAVNLTPDHRAHGQKWAKGSSLNKAEIRLMVEIPDEDPLLVKWEDFARVHVDPDFYATLNSIGGRDSKLWYIYRGTIPWAWVKAVRNTQTHKDLIVTENTFTPKEIEASRASGALGQKQTEELKSRLRSLGNG
jgi:hypothetical protein